MTVGLVCSCTQRGPSSVSSPSGFYTVQTEISGDEAGPTRRLCVKLKVTEIHTKKEIVFQTGASDVQKWALGWSPDNAVVLYSSDRGIYSYEIRDGAIHERPANQEEQEVGRNAYEVKYGKRPT